MGRWAGTPALRAASGMLGALVLVAAGAALAQPTRGRIGFLSGPRAGDPLDVARDHLRSEAPRLGLLPADIDAAVLRSRRRAPRSGVTSLFLRQRHRGLDVVGADLGISLDPEGRVLARWSRFVADLARAAPEPDPGLPPQAALSAAAVALGLPPAAPASVLSRPGGPAREVRLASPPLSRDPIPVRLVYWRRPGGGVALAWHLVLRPPAAGHWWELVVGADDGALLERADWVAHDSYRVYPLPLHDPDDGPRALVVDPATGPTPPSGWHDDGGSASPDYTDTRGNNVWAQEDGNANDAGGFRPSGGGSLVFDFPLDLSQPPSGYVSASLANLFYWNNVAHDLFRVHGFDEASGNFQTDNYGRGGSAGDAVFADGQDGADLDNARFFTPPDGSSPRMEMFVWVIGARVDVQSPAGLAGLRRAGEAAFGPALDATGITGDVAAALDPDTDACSPLTNPSQVAGKIALVDRGACNFVDKVEHCQDAGALAVIVANNQGDDVFTMGDGGTSGPIAIPSLLIGQSDGAALRSALGGGVVANLRALPARDSSLDSGIVLHEYGHGVTNRLTGGRFAASCLDLLQSASLGEGWSDFFALALTAEPGETGPDPRPIGAYADAHVSGIRSAPYSTDPAVNDAHYGELPTRSAPHAVGEIWAATLWEAYWNLVQAYGFDTDLAAGTGGNNRALGLVMDALSLQPCDPTFLEARDAVLAAELAATGGADACFLWDAFAERGMGDAAADDADPASVAVTEDFSVPAACLEYCADGILQAPEKCDDGNRIDFDGCHSVCLLEDEIRLAGSAEGGSVTVVVSGVELTVATTAGQSATQVVAALAAAIDADPTLGAQGISALADGRTLVTGGSIDSFSIDDPGLLGPVPLPALAAGARALLAAALLAAFLRRGSR